MRPALLLALAPMFALLDSPVAAQGQPGAQGQAGACFYEHANFQGQRMCFSIGQRVPMVSGPMNDQFSSLQVFPGVRVTIYEHANFAGRCVPVDRPIANFNEIGFNDRVSSVSVEPAQAGPGPGRPPMDGPGRPRDFGPPLPRGPQVGGGPPPRRFDDARGEMYELRAACNDGDRRACIRFGIAIGRNWERRERWQQESPEFFSWEREG